MTMVTPDKSSPQRDAAMLQLLQELKKSVHSAEDEG